MEVKPFDGRGYRLGGDGPLTSSALSTDPNQTTSQFAALSEDPHTQSSFGSWQTPLLFNESMEFCVVGTSIDVDTILDASDSDVSQDGDTEVSEDNILEILRECRDVVQSWLLRLEQHAHTAEIIKQVDGFVVGTTLFLSVSKGEPLISPQAAAMCTEAVLMDRFTQYKFLDVTIKHMLTPLAR